MCGLYRSGGLERVDQIVQLILGEVGPSPLTVMEPVQWKGFELGGTTGALIVDEEKPPEVDQDLVLIFDDWRIGTKGKID